MNIEHRTSARNAAHSVAGGSNAERRRVDRVTVYRPNQRHELGILETWAVMMRNVVRSRELIWQLFKRDFLASYKKSFLGFTWLFITPILGILSWVFMQMTGLLRPGDVGIPYPAYVLIGTSMWGLLIGFYDAASTSLMSGRSLLMQVNFPHEALLFKTTAEHLARFLITFLLNIIVLACFGVVPSWGILLFPLVALPLFLLGSAIGLVASMINVVAVDLSKVITAGLGLLMFTTPVIYGNNLPSPVVKAIVRWNPLSYMVCSCRDIILYGTVYDGNILAYLLCAAMSFLLFMMSWRLFYVSEHKLVERML